MKKNGRTYILSLVIYFFTFFLFISISQAEKVPAGYVAQWETHSLSELDYKINLDKTCQSFGGILQKGKLEMPHITPFKIINNTLLHFINGYNISNKNNNEFSTNEIDTVVIWPNYEQANWYVLMGSDSCLVSWIEIQPDNLDAIIHSGKKL
jgi:hypothetical protein